MTTPLAINLEKVSIGDSNGVTNKTGAQTHTRTRLTPTARMIVLSVISFLILPLAGLKGLSNQAIFAGIIRACRQRIRAGFATRCQF